MVLGSLSVVGYWLLDPALVPNLVLVEGFTLLQTYSSLSEYAIANTTPVVMKIVIGSENPIVAAIPPVNKQARIAHVSAEANFSLLVDFSIQMNATLYEIFSFSICL